MDCKRQNKLLKLAVGRLQQELEAKDKMLRDAGLLADPTFVTQGKGATIEQAAEGGAAQADKMQSIEGGASVIQEGASLMVDSNQN